MRVVKSKRSHALYIASNIRLNDRVELDKVGLSASDALLHGLESGECYTALADDVPCMMFGLVPNGFSSALVWALGTDAISDNRKQFLSESKKWRDSFLSDYDMLYNYVDADNHDAVRWLTWLGAKFDEPIPRGKGVFMRFELCVNQPR